MHREGGELDHVVRIVVGNGEVKICRDHGVLQYDSLGVRTRYFGTFQDITRQKKSEAEQENLRQQLLRSQKIEALGALTAGIAHDFNNILASVLGYSSLGLRTNVRMSDSMSKDYFRTIKEAAERGQELVSKLLTFSRLAPVNAPNFIDPVPVVIQAERMLRRLLPSTIDLSSQVPSVNFTVAGTEAELEQVLLNLGINARDAVGGHGRISISVNSPRVYHETCSSCHQKIAGQFAEIAISDTGPGVEPAAIDRIFDPFFTTKEFGKGSGLGLSIAHGVMHQAGGISSSIQQSAPARRSAFFSGIPTP